MFLQKGLDRQITRQPVGQITPYDPARGAYSLISPGAKVRYAAHIGLNADMGAGLRKCRYCCKSLFAPAIKNFIGFRRGDRIITWGGYITL
jgi:hypothetical protein